MACYLGFTNIVTSKLLFKHLSEQSFSLNNINYKSQSKRSMLGELDL